MIDAVLFDYGNTLVPFHGVQIGACDAALAEAIAEQLGPFDRERMLALRHADRLAPYQGELRENDLRTITTNLVRALFGHDPHSEVIEALMATRRRAFVEVVRAEEHVGPLLEQLRSKYRLALVSNYPCGWSIRTSLARNGLDRYFDAVVVSGDVGHVKPHPKPFREALEALGVPAERAVYVGDNWLADIQGPKRLGMRAIWLREHAPAERFEPGEGDHPADHVITRLSDLDRALGALTTCRQNDLPTDRHDDRSP